jgi:hypothetical protein
MDAGFMLFLSNCNNCINVSTDQYERAVLSFQCYDVCIRACTAFMPLKEIIT